MSNYKIDAVDLGSAIFKALANRNRLQIFLRIAQCCIPAATDHQGKGTGCCVGDLNTDPPLAASTLSHHLKELHQAGLVHLERQGQFVRCRVNPEAAAAVEKFLVAIQPAGISQM